MPGQEVAYRPGWTGLDSIELCSEQIEAVSDLCDGPGLRLVEQTAFSSQFLEPTRLPGGDIVAQLAHDAPDYLIGARVAIQVCLGGHTSEQIFNEYWGNAIRNFGKTPQS